MARGRRVWRVRPWIRAVTVLITGALVWMQLASPSWGVSAAEVHSGWFWMLGMSALTLYLAWVPFVAVCADGRWIIQGWSCRLASTVDQYGGHAMTPFGLRFRLKDGRTFTSVVFQDTALLFGDPRYYELIEALTGARPVPDPRLGEDW